MIKNIIKNKIILFQFLILFSISFILFIGSNKSLQAENLEWVIFNDTNSGLPHNYVWSVEIDKEGYIWIGTTEGLAKFDGISNWTVYTTANSGLSDDDIYKIAIDSNGNKWIGTYNSGLVKYDDKTWTVYNKKNSCLQDNKIQEIAIDRYNNKWVGTFWGGIAKFDDDMNCTVYDSLNSGLPHNAISGISFDKNDNIWIGTQWYGLAKLDKEGKWIVYNKSNSKLPSNIIGALSIDKNQYLWIGTYPNGPAKFDRDSIWVFYNLQGYGFKDIAFENNGNIWFGTFEDNGLIKYNNDSSFVMFNKSNSELPGSGVMSIAIDKFGNKWLGTWGGGVAVYREGGVILGINDKQVVHNQSNFFIYPNPTTNTVSIKFKVEYVCSPIIKIYNSLGIVVYEEREQPLEPDTYTRTIDVSNLSGGFYILEVNQSTTFNRNKLVIIK